MHLGKNRRIVKRFSNNIIIRRESKNADSCTILLLLISTNPKMSHFECTFEKGIVLKIDSQLLFHFEKYFKLNKFSMDLQF